ncbi:ATP-binding protein [Nocardiopsis sp. NPDC058631]|uniref:ATP-binding protein n=1 Tax=Nocardiopsis sp. NPDC058631 TaxID=3346566 RepID=UPI00365CE1F7
MQPTAPSPALPRRMCGTDTTSGILIGSDTHHVKAARQWAAQTARARPGLAHPLSVVVSELATNALLHTASGLPHGTVRIELERTPRHLELRVTDNGPRPGTAATLPTAPAPDPLPAGGNGLRLVEALCSYWDWEQGPCGAITVRAVFPR